MADSRQRILAGVRRALGRRDPPPDIDAAYDRLVRQRAAAVQPPFSQSVFDTFVSKADEAAAEVYTIDTPDDLPNWIGRRAAELGQNPEVVLSPALASLTGELSGFTVAGDVRSPHAWGIVRAGAGIAETGTVVSTSADCPSGLLFLVERLVVLLSRDDIVAYQEEVWDRLRKRFDGVPPRAVNYITGPSRTADVEQTIQLGAHGPRHVDYVVAGSR